MGGGKASSVVRYSCGVGVGGAVGIYGGEAGSKKVSSSSLLSKRALRVRFDREGEASIGTS